ncbi:hypothetical protein Scep_022747 [Stephania cephalantha]|uniref:Uncharacterized protein n=1 Tax=Stephania cephalantha TaxID=152367 RepID=A0AAP0FBB1_9MAGN
MYMSTSACPRGPTWTCTLIVPSAKALSVATWTRKGFPGPRGSTWTGKTRDLGAQIAPFEKALSAPHCRLPETDAENLCVGFSFLVRVGIGGRGGGRSRVFCWVGRLFKEGRVGAIRGERHEGGRKKEATVDRFLTGGGAYARRRRRRGGAAGSPEQGPAAFSSSSGSGTWRHFRGSGAWRKNSGPTNARRSDLRRAQGGDARRARESGERSGRRR